MNSLYLSFSACPATQKSSIPPLPTTHQKPKLHTSHSFSPTSSNRPVASVQPTTSVNDSVSQPRRFIKSHSEEQFQDKSPDIGSPSSFPSWKENLKPVNPTPPPNTSIKESTETESTTGIDEGNPGGVNTLRSRFEKASSMDATTAIQNGKFLSRFLFQTKSSV